MGNVISMKTKDQKSSSVCPHALAEELSFDCIYDQYHKNVYNYITFRINNQHDAEELANDVFVKAMQSQHSYNPKYAIEAWLIGIAKNVVTDYLRKIMRRQTISFDSILELVSDNKRNQPEEVVVISEEIKELLSAMTMLSNKERQILSMKFATGLKHREIGKLLGISQSNVKVTAHRGLNKLKKHMKEGKSNE